jgi:predicted nucleotidyltransferase
MDPQPLTKEHVAERLAQAREQIQALGVRRIALFGSVVRGEARVDSDVDFLIAAWRRPELRRSVSTFSRRGTHAPGPL